MFDFKNDLKVLVPRQTRYCVWIREHEGENARLVQVWIDPEMSGFETRTTEPEHVMASAEAESQELDSDSDGPNWAGREKEVLALPWKLFHRSFALLLLIVCALALPNANAQTTGKVSGVVRDSTGAVIAGASVTTTKAAPPRISQVAQQLLF